MMRGREAQHAAVHGVAESDTTGQLNNNNIYDEVLLSYKKEWSSVLCSNMDGPKEYYA